MKSTNKIVDQWARLLNNTADNNARRRDLLIKILTHYINNIARHFGRSKDNPMTDEEQNTQLPREIYAGY